MCQRSSLGGLGAPDLPLHSRYPLGLSDLGETSLAGQGLEELQIASMHLLCVMEDLCLP